jgi:O-antigen/teichoic acid export membrane protein
VTATVKDPVDLGSQVRRGVLWSTLNNVGLRAGTLVVGVVLARLLAPEQFGVYAVALIVQTVLMNFADLGLGADLIRSADPDRRAPTVATLGLVASGALGCVMAMSAGTVAELFGTPEAAPVIALLSMTMILAGAGVVPYAYLHRRFDQRALFVVAATDLFVSTTVTLVLFEAGHGVMSLAWGRVVAQSVSLALQIKLSGVRPHPGFDREIGGSVLRFGIPVAGANTLSWTLLNAGSVVIARTLPSLALPYYVLAFNMATWPMTAIGQVVRSVALPAFARSTTTEHGSDRSLALGVGLSWTLAVPAGAFLAIFAHPLVVIVYGDTWARAAAVLVPLGIFGAFRVLFDLFVTYLLARGQANSTFVIQVLWFVALVPALLVGASEDGLVGVGWAHVVVAVVVVLPAYLVAARRAGADLRPVMPALWRPVVFMVPTALAAFAVGAIVHGDAERLLAGGAAGAVVYTGCAWRTIRPYLSTARHQEMSGADRVTDPAVECEARGGVQ